MEDNNEENLENNNIEREEKDEREEKLEEKKEEKKEKEEKPEEKEEKVEKSERSKFSLEGAKEPISLYTRRVINIDNIRSYLKEDSTHGLCGGANLGNTCFMNSSIACLSNCTELTCYFLSGDYKKDINRENKLGMEGKLAEHWGDLLQEYWVLHTKVGDPSEFKKIFGEKIKRFKGYDQQDSNEFIDLFLDLLNEDLNSVSNKAYEEIKEKGKDESDEECSKRFWENYIKRNDSIVTDLFCGQIKCTLTCPECQYANVTFDPFNSLNLNIPEEKEEDKIKFQFFYVPKYFLRTPIRIIYQDTPKKATFKDLFRCLKNEKEFKYHEVINKLIINKIDQRKSLEFIKEEDSLSIEKYNNGFYFCYDIINQRENVNIPIYFKDIKGIAEYPKVIMVSEQSTMDDLIKKIYFNIRKLILSPLKKEGEEIDSLSSEINNYKQNIEVKDDYIFGLIDKEYKEVFNEDINNENDENNDKNNCLKMFKEDMPFKVYLVKNLEDKEGKIYILDEKNFVNISKEFTDLTNIKSYDDTLENLLKIINDYYLIIEFKNNSKYINKNLYKLNICVRCFYDYVEEKTNKMKEKLTLKKCFELFSREEQLKEGNEWNCSNCKKKVLASKKMEIYYTPKILILCFKRFKKSSSYTWERNDEDIDFPIENMDMKEYMIGPDKDHSVYDLFAVSQHYGGTGFGHYTATCKNLNNWYYYNDSSIHQTNADSVLSPSAYVLFYRRKTD